ncbi:pentatricopeptide repeat-containing protein, chloroplastic [Iris pallida]|uniref:Pentatricopeptide repeat-containing protein, chloroplastic n=1 Tax=Iris pallida TaxID=29817 RepID=A0AAX6HDJ6_IRIPA|nr:pentatricopeptide repeat-containing protein, chloroplastic [Iris pallida]
MPLYAMIPSPPTLPLTLTSPISLIRRTKQKHKRSTKIHTPPPPPPPNPNPQTQQHAVLQSVLQDIQSSAVVVDDPSLFSSLLETCHRLRSPLTDVILLHSLIPPRLLRTNAGLSSKLVRLYSSLGCTDLAHQLFDEMPARNRTLAFPWNSLLHGYSSLGLFHDALALYHQMDEEGVAPDRFTFPRALRACAGLGLLHHGEAVHRHAVRSGLALDPFVLNALVHMYAKCGDIVKARNIFSRIEDRDSVSWNSMIAAYFRHGLPADALDTCRGMLRAGVEPDPVTLSTMLAGVSTFGRTGLEVHCWVLRRGLEGSLSVANSLVGLYSARGQPDHARTVLESMPEKDLVSWNAVISAHSRDYRVLSLFRKMEECGPRPDRVTFVSLLSACANLGMVEDGRRLFSEMEKVYGIKPGTEHYGCMVNMLGRAGLFDEAYEIVSKRMEFDAGPTVWGALLFASSMHGNVAFGEAAAERLFELEPDNEHNFELMMKIYRNAGRSEDVRRVRRLMRERGLESGS